MYRERWDTADLLPLNVRTVVRTFIFYTPILISSVLVSHGMEFIRIYEPNLLTGGHYGSECGLIIHQEIFDIEDKVELIP